MTLGEKIRQARLEAGLSQRQLCGDTVTRNMLSQIENGSARPSMDTLSYFAARLGKTVSFFLEEDVVASPNQALMEAARAAWRAGEGTDLLEILESYHQPDPVFDPEKQLLERLGKLQAAEAALQKNQAPLAAALLEEEPAWQDGYCARLLERQRLLLLIRARPKRTGRLLAQLPSMDEELLLRAQSALKDGMKQRCLQLLEAAQDREAPLWNLLRGQLYLEARQFAEAAQCLRKAEAVYPEKCVGLLEICYRELGDFRQAYYYACKGKE